MPLPLDRSTEVVRWYSSVAGQRSSSRRVARSSDANERTWGATEARRGSRCRSRSMDQRDRTCRPPCLVHARPYAFESAGDRGGFEHGRGAIRPVREVVLATSCLARSRTIPVWCHVHPTRSGWTAPDDGRSDYSILRRGGREALALRRFKLVWNGRSATSARTRVDEFPLDSPTVVERAILAKTLALQTRAFG